MVQWNVVCNTWQSHFFVCVVKSTVSTWIHNKITNTILLNIHNTQTKLSRATRSQTPILCILDHSQHIYSTAPKTNIQLTVTDF